MWTHRWREMFLGNWRNKGVALFFAVTIWYVAFQSETQSETLAVRLVLAPRSPQQVIIRQDFQDPQGRQLPFNGTVVLSVNGPRKQVQKLRQGAAPETRFPVEAGPDGDSMTKRVVLSGAAFAFVPAGVRITGISPDTLFVTFDAAEDAEFEVKAVYQRLPEGMETESPKIEPATAFLHGPESVLDQIRVIAEVWLGAADRFDERVPLILRYPETLDKALVDGTVWFVDREKKRISDPEVRVTLRLRHQSETLLADSVPIRFLVPATRFPFRIQFEEESIAVKFQGPVQEIRRLEAAVKTPDFALAVRVPAMGGDGAQTIPFTEDRLLLPGFSERVQILQHPSRQAQGKGAWTYSLVPTSQAAAGAGQ